MWRLIPILVVLVGTLLGCSANPVRKTLKLCPACESTTLARSASFPLLAYVHNADAITTHEFLHVYLEGDGQPWLRPSLPAANPNPWNMTALKLMLLDPNTSIYLNRPCYGYAKMPAKCSLTMWTDGRYSTEVVDAMVLGLQELGRQFPHKRLVLLGHSGGGTLAMLLAQRVEKVAAVVTVAANLDHRAWTSARGFSPLSGSLNPADEMPLPDGIIRWHLAGGADQQVPVGITEDVARRDPAAHFILHPNFDHTCCWQRIWQALLQELDTQLTGTK